MGEYLRKTIPENFFLRRWYSVVRSTMAAMYYGFPAKELQVIAVTGTDGKTTTTSMIAHILRKCNKKILTITTAEIRMGQFVIPVDKRTTPDAWMLQRFFKEAVKQNIEIVVLEVSSHALVQGRIFGVGVDSAVLTNITPEHLDYHRTFVGYQLAKKKLFKDYLKPNGAVILNLDDQSGRAWSREFLAKGKKVYTYSAKGDARATRAAEEITYHDKGVEFLLHDKNKECNERVFVPVFGSFNVANALAAILAVRPVGIYCPEAAVAMKDFPGIAGRMERISVGQDFTVFVDFALTPGAFTKMLASARRMAKRHKLIVVFGSPGSHPDPEVRKEIGRIVANEADLAIVTDDETYYQNPKQIRSQLLDGAFAALGEAAFVEKVKEIGDRQRAIEFAISSAVKGDVVVISGMGHLTTRNMGGTETSWSDIEVVKSLLRKRVYSANNLPSSETQ
jgi:UDP-N-acetylmuramoyl-L-alanyl-D-glutamate--2,6-diaminopimelate ligase